MLRLHLKICFLKNKNNIKKLEKIIHPLVRKKMKDFTSQNRNKRLLFIIPTIILKKPTQLYESLKELEVKALFLEPEPTVR